jgi:sulfur relay protein TusB/DsrH
MLLTRNPQAKSDWRAVAQPGDVLLLADAGVEWLVPGRFESPEKIDVYALRSDVNARGLGGLAAQSGATLVDETDWVALVARHAKTLSWK